MSFFRKYYQYFLLFIFCFLITFLYNFFFLNVNCDEIWNYGFSYNIINGLIPYRDFNVVVTPFFFWIGSIFIRLFGSYIWSYDIYISIIVSLLMCLCYHKYGKITFLLLFVLVPHFGPSYNALCFLFSVIILFILDIHIKQKEFWIGLLIGIIFLTKQSIGISLFIVMFFCLRKKLKVFGGFLVPNLLFLIYLIYYGALYSFLDNCFLGLLDFNHSNLNFSIAYMPIFMVVFIIIVIQLIKGNMSRQKLFLVLGFQSVAYPIFDANHVMLGVFFYLIFLLEIYCAQLNKNFKYYILISLTFFISYCSLPKENYRLYQDKKSFLNYKGIYDSDVQATSHYDSATKIMKQNIQGRINNYDELFIFSLNRTDYAYVCKLDLGYPIGKFDLINNGNMGYLGDKKLIEDMKNICQNSRCLFIVDNDTDNLFPQANKNIYFYVINHYQKIDEISNQYINFSIYES